MKKIIVSTLAVILAVSVVLPALTQADEDRPVTSDGAVVTSDNAPITSDGTVVSPESDDYWTRDRMREAKPLPIGVVVPLKTKIMKQRRENRDSLGEVGGGSLPEEGEVGGGSLPEEGGVRGIRADVDSQIKDFKSGRLEEFKARREQFRSSVEAKGKEFKINLELKREEAKNRIEAKREEMKQKFERIKDERKKKLVEKISERMTKLNERLTEHFSNVLAKLRGFVTRVESRMAKAEEKGMDVSAVEILLDDALSAIEVAETVVAEQAGKIYDFEINTEDTLRSDVGVARQQLHNDLRAVLETIKNARDAIRNAVKALAQIPRVDEMEVNDESDNDESEVEDDDSDNDNSNDTTE